MAYESSPCAENILVSLWILFLSLRDGIPPYRVGSKKQLQREMHRSVKANGQVSLPHFPVSTVWSEETPVFCHVES